MRLPCLLPFRSLLRLALQTKLPGYRRFPAFFPRPLCWTSTSFSLVPFPLLCPIHSGVTHEPFFAPFLLPGAFVLFLLYWKKVRMSCPPVSTSLPLDLLLFIGSSFLGFLFFPLLFFSFMSLSPLKVVHPPPFCLVFFLCSRSPSSPPLVCCPSRPERDGPFPLSHVPYRGSAVAVYPPFVFFFYIFSDGRFFDPLWSPDTPPDCVSACSRIFFDPFFSPLYPVPPFYPCGSCLSS